LKYLEVRRIIMDINGERDKNGIKKDMEELREILNEVCVLKQGKREMKRRLIISQQLDELIVEYMNKDSE
jgi:hypothetical protein